MPFVRGEPFVAQFHDPATNDLMSGGSIEFYLTNTSTPTPYYTDSTGTSGGTSLTLDSGGQPPNAIFFDTAVAYRLVVKDSSGTTLRTVDPYNPVGQAASRSTNTVSSMTAISKATLVDNEYFTTLGYTSIGDGGTRSYYWDSSSTETADSIDYFASDEGGTGRFVAVDTFTLNVKQAGAVGDGTTDDTAAIQAALDWMRSKNTNAAGTTVCELVFPTGQYKISSVLYLPFGFGFAEKPDALSNVRIVGYGATIIGSGSDDTDHDIFESAYWNGTNNVTTIGTAGESRLAYGVKVEGFYIRDARRAFYLQNWNQGCAIRDIYCVRVQSALDAARCFYIELNNIKSREAPTTDSKPNFRFQNFSNIMPIRGLHSSGHATGYQVGGADGLMFEECSLENSTDGMAFTSENSLITLHNCYLEACTNATLRIDDIIRTLNITGCFINQGTDRIIDASALPSSQFALVNMTFNHIESGDLEIDTNIIGTFYGNRSGDSPFESTGIFAPGYAYNPKIVNYGPDMIIDTSASGFDGGVRLINVNNDHLKSPGVYTGGFGHRTASDTTPWHTMTESGTSPNIVYTFDFDIDFEDMLMGVWHVSYDDGGTTINRSFFVMAEPGSGATVVNLYTRDSGSDQLTEASTVYPGDYTVSNNAGRLRIAINGISTTHQLRRSILRIF